jgi:putative FmdB family regulatory protein
MPFYEYECANCKFYIEEMQKISDPPLTKCPSCGKEALKKLVSAPNFRLKGAGWYETDFKSDKEDKRNLAGSDAEEAPKAESTAESSKTEAEAPASKPEVSKPETVTTKEPSKAPSKVAASKSASGSGSAPSKGSSGKRSSTVRPAKPATRVAASKTRSAPAVRSKSKPAAKAAARKK